MHCEIMDNVIENDFYNIEANLIPKHLLTISHEILK